MCTTLHIVDLAYQKIQDPLKTYNDPEGAVAESEAQKRLIESLIDQYGLLYPPGKGTN
jgi:hypothetical protein